MATGVEVSKLWLQLGRERLGVAVNHFIKLIYFSREQGSKRDSNEEEKMQRLFVMVPKNMTDSELYDYFKQFGDIDYASIIKDKSTRENKGFAYVKYIK